MKVDWGLVAIILSGPESVFHNNPNRLALMHQLKSVVNLVQRQLVGDHWVNLNLADHIPVNNFGYVCAA